MNCPSCKTNSIAFLTVWLKGEQKCNQCSLLVKMKRVGFTGYLVIPLSIFISSYFNLQLFGWNWTAAVLIALIIVPVTEGIKDYYSGELERVYE